MKFLFAFLFFTVLVLNVLGKALTEDEIKEHLKQKMKECQDDPATHLSHEQIQKLIHHEDVDLSIVGPHIVCMSKKMHRMNDDGTPNPEGIKKVLKHFIDDDAKIDEIIKECANKKSTDAETAVEMGKCLAKHNPHHQ